MATIGSRKVKDLIDNQTQEPIYIKGHAQATFMSDGATVEDAINNLLVSGIGDSGTTGESIPSSVTAEPNTIVKRDGAGQVYANAVIDENNMIWVTPTSSIDTIESADRVIQERITDIDEIRAGAAKGATALQSYTEQYTGTVTAVKINGTTKSPSSGVVDLGDVITSHQDISHLAEKAEIPTKISDLDGGENLLETTNIKTVNGENIVKGADGSTDIKTQLAYAEYTGTAAAAAVTTKYGYFPTTLVEGASVAVKFEGNVSYITTLDVNGTGAKNVYYKGNSLSGGSINRYNTYLFVYDGSYYRIIGVNTDTDTHYSAKNVVTSSATSKSNAAATDGNVYLNLIENSTVRSTHKIVGNGATTVTSDTSGNITIGTQLKTINGESIIGSGDIIIEGGGGASEANVQAVDISENLEDVEDITFEAITNGDIDLIWNMYFNDGGYGSASATAEEEIINSTGVGDYDEEII
jgi:hypothetical protein